ncbi:unnamed protein product [Cylindrotheca closterium]|uniref:Uncharacterized protein n=1 Tax=Cylindrotheca closterium TaxID=2856 RepID=A0AAD2CSV4_9STRA|nr:unnamed protein product [Cylindrotheca closterium]
MSATNLRCVNCKRTGDDVRVKQYSRVLLRGRHRKTYNCVPKLTTEENIILRVHGQDALKVWLCSCCDHYLLGGSNDPADYWPAMVYKFLVHENSEHSINVSVYEKWQLIPSTWRPWWRSHFAMYNFDETEKSLFVDFTEELEEVKEAIDDLGWVRLTKQMDKHFAYPEIRCPFGCSEFLHKTNHVPLKDFLWCYSNYEMQCYEAPKGKNWTDFISPSYPSFQPNVFSDTFCTVKQVGGFGGIDSAYVTTSNVPMKSDTLSCNRDFLSIQGRPDIRAQINERSTDKNSPLYMSRDTIESIFRASELKYPDLMELPETATSTFVPCDVAVKLQEMMYEEASKTIKVFEDDGDHFAEKLFAPPWPSDFVEVHPLDGHGQRFHKVTNGDFGFWMFLCITGRVRDLWQAIASSVEDNRSWHGHWLQFASNVLTIPGKTAKSRYFPALAEKKVHDLFPVRLEDTLNDKAKTADLFCSCRSVFVVEGSLSQVEASDQELEGKEVVICVNPKYPEVTTDRAESFELRCLVSGNLDNRQMFVRHKGQKFWVQNGALHLCRYEGADLHDGAYLGARIAVFCPRRSVGKLTSLKRRYLAAIGGQRCVHCDVHKCPLVLNHHHKKSSENTYKCVCREGWQHNRDEVCGQFGSYSCPYLDCCNISICDNHLSKSRNRCNSIGPEAAMFLSEVGSCFFSNDGVSDDGAFRGRCESSIANHVLPEALGPTAGHELPQDIVGEYGANCIMEDNSDSGSSFGSYDMVAEDNLEEPWNFVAAPTNDEDQQRVVVGDQEHNNSVNRSHVSEHFGAEDLPTTTIPTTTTGTDQCEIAVDGGQFIQRGHTDNHPRQQGMMLFQHNNTGIHLDSGSTFHLRTNEDDFKEESLQRIHGGFHYASNVEGRELYREGIDKVFDSVCKLDTRASDNVNSLSNMVQDGFDVFMDTKRENSFFVTRNGTTWRFGHRNGLYTLVDEPAVATAMFHNHARGIDNAGVDPRFDIEIERYKGMAFILQRDRINIGEPMNGYHDLWKWTKFAQWCYELAKDRRWDFDDLDIFSRLTVTFAEEAKRRGIRKDFHEWTDGRGFIYDEVPAGMELDEIHIVPNNLNDNMEGYCALQSVEKNKEGFTNKQVKRANVARSGYHMMGAPGAELFKLAIRGNFFKNCPITEEDVNISEKIYGPSVSTIKGKQKRPTPKAVVDDWIEMPKELLKHNLNLDLCIDIMFINNVAFFVSIDKAIKFRFSTELKDRTKDAIYKSIDKILRIYNHAEFRIKTIYCDNEFKPVFDDVKDNLDVTVNYAAPGEHEPTIERSNQTL